MTTPQSKQEQGEPVAIVEKVIKNLEPLLDAKNQSWAKAEKMLLSILENQSEQPKQEQRSDSEQLGEPVAVMELHEGGWDLVEDIDTDWLETLPFGTKLYTTPQQRKPLTFERVYELWLARFDTNEYDDVFMNFARAIEATHGIKE